MTEGERNPFEQLLPEDIKSLAGDIRIEFSQDRQAVVVRENRHSIFRLEQEQPRPDYSLQILREV